PYLLKDMEITAPNQVWCTDITYIRLGSGFVYLTAVMDWHTRYVLSWEISTTMETYFCISAVQSAIRRHGKPEVFNTDQGSQYTSHEFTGMLESQYIQISMDVKGRWADNIMIERLWRSVKYEEIYTKEYASVGELIAALRTYFLFYNNERRHSGLEQKTPAEAYGNQQNKLAIAA
ncbi:MAG: IS3 family transposase, partial [Mariprofundaceae bacterium]|nr:IS3 family transposase [Mariprofundaceae bacterium]